ncbi:MAG: multidrug efflux SMR transporter [Bacteroidota bacterium]
MQINPWLILFIAGLFETCWAVGLKNSDGFRHLGWSVFTAITLGLSMWLLAVAVRTLPLGTAYAVWTGIGATGAAILGIFIFNEPAALPRLFCLLLIVSGIVGLKWLN